jgi:hypothetical protein
MSPASLQPETWRLLADAVLVLHLAFVIFVVGGGWLVLRWRWLAWVHVPAAVWGAVIEFGGWLCPLTPLENRLRQAGGEHGYSGSFVDQYLLPIVYPPQLTHTVQVLLGCAVVLVNVVAYTVVVRSRTRRYHQAASRHSRGETGLKP